MFPTYPWIASRALVGVLKTPTSLQTRFPRGLQRNCILTLARSWRQEKPQVIDLIPGFMVSHDIRNPSRNREIRRGSE